MALPSGAAKPHRELTKDRSIHHPACHFKAFSTGLFAAAPPQIAAQSEPPREKILDRSEADQRRAAEILDRQEALMARVERIAELLEKKLAD